MGEASRAIVAANLVRLMDAAGETIKQLHARCPSVSTGTIDRIRRGVVSAGVDNVAALAEAYGLEPWQLLLPDLDPKAMPIDRMAVTADERELLLAWREKVATRPRTLADLPHLPAGVVLIPERRQPAGKEVTSYPGNRRKVSEPTPKEVPHARTAQAKPGKASR